MIYIIPLLSVGIARALQSFAMPDIKPFNCQSCMSFWTTVAIFAMYEWRLCALGFISYLISDLILIYENK